MQAKTKTLWTFAITSVALFMVVLDNLIVTTALPSIRNDLGGGLEDLEWTVSAYTLTFAVLLMFGASLGDRFGRRRLFAIGLAIFTTASAAAALAPGMGELIAARAAQGVGVRDRDTADAHPAVGRRPRRTARRGPGRLGRGQRHRRRHRTRSSAAHSPKTSPGSGSSG